MADLERRAFYMTPTNGVIQPLETTGSVVVVENPETGERWTLKRDALKAAIDRGEVQRVEANWRPVEPVRA